MDGNATDYRLADDPPGFIRVAVGTGTILIRQEDGWLAIYKNQDCAYHYRDIGGWNAASDRFLPIEIYYTDESTKQIRKETP